MHNVDIKDFIDYRKYLNFWLESQPKGGHGLKSKMAEAAGCRLAYMSKVFNGHGDFSAEQALKLSQFLILSKEEAKYFRLLVDYSRASCHELRQVLMEEITTQRKEKLEKKLQIDLDQSLDDHGQTEYYSAWHYSAIHIALTVPDLSTASAIASELKLPVQRVNEVILRLIDLGLVEKKGGQFIVTDKAIHTDGRSVNARHHLVNMRTKAMEAAQSFCENDLQFSAIYSLSNEDFETIRDIFKKSIERTTNIVKKSDELKLAMLNVDWIQF